MKRRHRFILLTIPLSLLAGCAPRQNFPPNTLSLTGQIKTPVTWTADSIRARFATDIKAIDYTLKGEKHSAHAVPLLALVNAGGPALNPKVKNDQLHFVVAVNGADGYISTFALVELSPDGGNREAWITLDMDGKPLPDRNAPASLIVPGDQKPERWVRAIQSIRVVEIK